MSLPYYNPWSLAPNFLHFPTFHRSSLPVHPYFSKIYTKSSSKELSHPTMAHRSRPATWSCGPGHHRSQGFSTRLIFRLQSPSAFRMVEYIVLDHQQDSKHVTGALPSKLPKDRTTEPEAWIRIPANSSQFSLYHSGAPNHPLIYPAKIID